MREGGEGGGLDGEAGADNVEGVGGEDCCYAGACAAEEAVKRRETGSGRGFEVLSE